MTGIERLRELADKYAELGKDHTTIDVVPSGMAMLFSSIANQIEREHAEDCYGMVIDHGTVSRVVSDMERHILGHEGMEDSPVARWARELREALGGDAEADEDREAAAWVRDHGGLDAVERHWECLDYYADPVPRSCMDKRLARLQRQIDECHEALRRRNQRIEELTHRVGDLTTENAELRKRLMPEGMEWPRYESSEQVRIGDYVQTQDGPDKLRQVRMCRKGYYLSTDGCDEWHRYGERVKRPQVPATDGEPEPPDSWERLKSDIYKEIEMQPTLRTTRFGIELFVSNVVLRCRALAERERGE